MKFVMSYSCGKDSTLALQKLTDMGNECIALLVMVNENAGRSYFHGADYELMEKFSAALDIPLIVCPSDGYDYHIKFEEGLKKAKDLGAEAVGFGDIDLEGNRQWGVDRCENAGLGYFYPLWQRDREDVLSEIIDAGYECIIKSVDKSKLGTEFLGRKLTHSLIEEMKNTGIDACGENGEYHTIVVNGPVFRMPLDVKVGDIIDFGSHAAVVIE
ncbi:MAG: diphthine--ammonia ligase [Anaerofustis stercorihominis]|nr:diphthine--ammonia ligase [Anaerofustis stercorihominis]